MRSRYAREIVEVIFVDAIMPVGVAACAFSLNMSTLSLNGDIGRAIYVRVKAHATDIEAFVVEENSHWK